MMPLLGFAVAGKVELPITDAYRFSTFLRIKISGKPLDVKYKSVARISGRREAGYSRAAEARPV
jgi:hypothetical protein